MSDNRLNNLFDLMVDEMTKLVKDGKTVIEKETGEAVKVSPDAASLNVIRQFLKDQGVSATDQHKGVKDLNASLPFKLSDNPQTDHFN